jgi:hypothetical protein
MEMAIDINATLATPARSDTKKRSGLLVRSRHLKIILKSATAIFTAQVR